MVGVTVGDGAVAETPDPVRETKTRPATVAAEPNTTTTSATENRQGRESLRRDRGAGAAERGTAGR